MEVACIKMLVGVGFPVSLLHSLLFLGVCEMMRKCCAVTPFKGRDCLHCLRKY